MTTIPPGLSGLAYTGYLPHEGNDRPIERTTEPPPEAGKGRLIDRTKDTGLQQGFEFVTNLSGLRARAWQVLPSSFPVESDLGRFRFSRSFPSFFPTELGRSEVPCQVTSHFSSPSLSLASPSRPFWGATVTPTQTSTLATTPFRTITLSCTAYVFRTNHTPHTHPYDRDRRHEKGGQIIKNKIQYAYTMVAIIRIHSKGSGAEAGISKHVFGVVRRRKRGERWRKAERGIWKKFRSWTGVHCTDGQSAHALKKGFPLGFNPKRIKKGIKKKKASHLTRVRSAAKLTNRSSRRSATVAPSLGNAITTGNPPFRPSRNPGLALSGLPTLMNSLPG